MTLFEDILLTVDFDRTLTDPHGKIPPRNFQAIEYFMANGGTFTVNTGRSAVTFHDYLELIPHNAPFLMYNGSAAYAHGELTQIKPIDLDVWEVLDTVHRLVPDLNLEVQGVNKHYLVEPHPDLVALYEACRWQYTYATRDLDMRPFIKFSLFGTPSKPEVANLYLRTPEEQRRFQEVEQTILELYGDKVDVYYAAPRIIDVHAKGVSKIAAARTLQANLGKKLLVCVGDAENDIPMLDGADHAFCPADGRVANLYNTVCPCAQGAVADVIYKKIPEILGLQLDIVE